MANVSNLWIFAHEIAGSLRIAAASDVQYTVALPYVPCTVDSCCNVMFVLSFRIDTNPRMLCF